MRITNFLRYLTLFFMMCVCISSIAQEDQIKHRQHNIQVYPTMTAQSVSRVQLHQITVLKNVLYEQNAVLLFGDCKVNADKLIAYYQNGILQRVVATGHVQWRREKKISNGEQRATSQSATYNSSDNTIILSGKVHFSQDRQENDGIKAVIGQLSYQPGGNAIALSIGNKDIYVIDM